MLEFLDDYDGVVIKHADAITGGIPDISWTRGARTYWLELKVLKPGEFSKARVLKDKIQFVTMVRLGIASGGRAFYLMEEPDRSILVAKPVTSTNFFELLNKGGTLFRSMAVVKNLPEAIRVILAEEV